MELFPYKLILVFVPIDLLCYITQLLYKLEYMELIS